MLFYFHAKTKCADDRYNLNRILTKKSHSYQSSCQGDGLCTGFLELESFDEIRSNNEARFSSLQMSKVFLKCSKIKQRHTCTSLGLGLHKANRSTSKIFLGTGLVRFGLAFTDLIHKAR